MRKHFQITVKGRGKFPIDMLRYSQVYPMTPQDVSNIEYTGKTNRPVTLCMDNQTMGMAMNCVERFASFGWVGEVFENAEMVYSAACIVRR